MFKKLLLKAKDPLMCSLPGPKQQEQEFDVILCSRAMTPVVP